ncbi:hypothetical protein CB1_001984022 [Camelus ferus]|nr:hypothetical protein CB1_001984022 [Camelus ferus]
MDLLILAIAAEKFLPCSQVQSPAVYLGLITASPCRTLGMSSACSSLILARVNAKCPPFGEEQKVEFPFGLVHLSSALPRLPTLGPLEVAVGLLMGGKSVGGLYVFLGNEVFLQEATGG